MADEKPIPINRNPDWRPVSVDSDTFWDDEIKEWAYELWAYRYGKSVKLTVERLNNPYPEDLITLDGRTIKYATVTTWVHRYKWSDKMIVQMKTIAPDLHDQVLGNMLASSLKMSEYAVRFSNDEVPLETREQQGKAKVMTEMAKAVWDRSGFIAWLSASDKGKPAAPSRSYEEAIGDMDDEMLRETLYGNFMKLADKKLKPEDDE